MTSSDQIWVALCAILVFVMQPGFMCVEAGITRSKNNINVAIKNIADFSLAFTTYWLVGYGLMYGASWAGLMGFSGFAPDAGLSSGDYVRLTFQAVFCGTAATIISGAVAERCSFVGYVAMTLVVAGFVYPVFGHWAWAVDEQGSPAGWLGRIGYYDFAGSGVVHALGGGAALAAILVIGPRAGRFLSSGQARRFNGSNLPLAVLGVLLLWLGWFGFNGGSVMRWTEDVPGILFRTMMGGAVGVLTGLAVSWAAEGKPSVFYGMNGALAGLVSITAGVSVFSIGSTALVGAVGGAIVVAGDKALERLRIDDAVGAVPVHLFCGLWGVLAVGLFADPAQLGTGLTALAQLGAQMLGVVVIALFCVGLPWIVFVSLDMVLPLRVTAHVEDIGLNVGEHGANTDLNELFDVMQRQMRDRDLTLRAPQSPFTDVGQIGLFYNTVMFELERSQARNQRQHEELLKSAEQKNKFLESILPKSVIARMDGGESQIVDQISDATVVFIDVVGFTEYSASVPSAESLALLQMLFRGIDDLIERHGLEKIKTIGDCYMFVSGIGDADPDHCAKAVEAALDSLLVVQQVGVTMGRPLSVRIGVNSGPVIAGIVGDHRYLYDLWGSTVNIAARLQEASRPNKVTVSEAVVDRLGSEFVVERQGRARLRGLGLMALFTVEQRRQGAVPERESSTRALARKLRLRG